MTEKKRCGAKLRNKKDRTCKRFPLNGRDKCKQHGGATPRGMDSVHYKHGRYSITTQLPGRLRESYENAINDPDILRLRSEIALAETRRQDLVTQLDRGSHEDFLDSLVLIQTEIKTAINAGDISRIRTASKELDDLLEKKRPDRSVWRALIEIEDHKRKLVESERKRNVELGQLLTLEQSFFLIKQLSDAVKMHVTDQTVMKLIINDIIEIQEKFD